MGQAVRGFIILRGKMKKSILFFVIFVIAIITMAQLGPIYTPPETTSSISGTNIVAPLSIKDPSGTSGLTFADNGLQITNNASQSLSFSNGNLSASGTAGANYLSATTRVTSSGSSDGFKADNAAGGFYWGSGPMLGKVDASTVKIGSGFGLADGALSLSDILASGSLTATNGAILPALGTVPASAGPGVHLSARTNTQAPSQVNLIMTEENISGIRQTNKIQRSVFTIDIRELGANGQDAIVGQDHNAIQAALDIVGTNGGGTVYLPPGTFWLTNQLLNPELTSEGKNSLLNIRSNNVRILGSGMNSTFVKLWPIAGYTNYYNMIGCGDAIGTNYAGTTNTIIEGFTIQGDPDGNANYIGDFTQFYNCGPVTFRAIRFGPSVTLSADAIDVASDNLLIESCQFENLNGSAIHNTLSGGYTRAENCIVKDCFTSGRMLADAATPVLEMNGGAVYFDTCIFAGNTPNLLSTLPSNDSVTFDNCFFNLTGDYVKTNDAIMFITGGSLNMYGCSFVVSGGAATATDYMINGGTNKVVKLRNNFFQGKPVLKMVGKGAVVENNVFQSAGSTSYDCINIFGGGTFQNNTFTSLTGIAIHLQGDAGVYGRADEAWIKNNWIGDYSTGIRLDNAPNGSLSVATNVIISGNTLQSGHIRDWAYGTNFHHIFNNVALNGDISTRGATNFIYNNTMSRYQSYDWTSLGNFVFNNRIGSYNNGTVASLPNQQYGFNWNLNMSAVSPGMTPTMSINMNNLYAAGTAFVTNGVASYRSNQLAAVSVGNPWTNNVGVNCQVFCDSGGATVSINGTQVYSDSYGVTIFLQPGEWVQMAGSGISISYKPF